MGYTPLLQQRCGAATAQRAVGRRLRAPTAVLESSEALRPSVFPRPFIY